MGSTIFVDDNSNGEFDDGEPNNTTNSDGYIGISANLSTGNTQICEVLNDGKRGEKVTYTISVCNHNESDVHNVTLWDVFSRHVEVLSYSPATGSNGKWHFDVPGNNCVAITIKIKVPSEQVRQQDQGLRWDQQWRRLGVCIELQRSRG